MKSQKLSKISRIPNMMKLKFLVKLIKKKDAITCSIFKLKGSFINARLILLKEKLYFLNSLLFQKAKEEVGTHHPTHHRNLKVAFRSLRLTFID